MIDRLGEKMIRPFLTLIMLLPGTPVIYYGDEIGTDVLIMLLPGTPVIYYGDEIGTDVLILLCWAPLSLPFTVGMTYLLVVFV